MIFSLKSSKRLKSSAKKASFTNVFCGFSFFSSYSVLFFASLR